MKKCLLLIGALLSMWMAACNTGQQTNSALSKADSLKIVTRNKNFRDSTQNFLKSNGFIAKTTLSRQLLAKDRRYGDWRDTVKFIDSMKVLFIPQDLNGYDGMCQFIDYPYQGDLCIGYYQLPKIEDLKSSGQTYYPTENTNCVLIYMEGSNFGNYFSLLLNGTLKHTFGNFRGSEGLTIDATFLPSKDLAAGIIDLGNPNDIVVDSYNDQITLNNAALNIKYLLVCEFASRKQIGKYLINSVPCSFNIDNAFIQKPAGLYIIRLTDSKGDIITQKKIMKVQKEDTYNITDKF